jgi:hypothetical protein
MLPGTAPDLRDQRVVGMDAAPDVPTVDREAVGYTELPKLTERVISPAMIQRGVIVTITRKVIVNNDVAAVQRIIDEPRRAALRTLARAVWSPWSSNATYGRTRTPGSMATTGTCRPSRSPTLPS